MLTNQVSMKCKSIILTTILLFISTSSANRAYVDFEFDCNSYQPKISSEKNCLSRLEEFPEEFEECQSGNRTCYLFIHEAPFNVFEYDEKKADVKKLQKPFRCGKYESVSQEDVIIRGTQFQLHNMTASANDLCAWAGESCTFDDLVDFIEVKANDDYHFAISGNLLETPQRQCRHDAGVATANDKVVIVGSRDSTISASTPLEQLIKPFHWGTWVIFAVVFFLYAIVCFCIAWRIQNHRQRSIVNAFLIFFGSSDNIIQVDGATQEENKSIQTRNGVVLSLYRVSFGAYVLIFILFYEVAVVNFLFLESTPELSHKISKLSESELKQYGVLANTALESVWISAVDEKGDKLNPNNPESYPWKRCRTYSDCSDYLRNGEIKFLVSFGIEARILLSEREDCERFAIFETKDTLYEFNAGWLYNSIANKDHRKKIDRQLLALRINGQSEVVNNEEIGIDECEAKAEPFIGPLTILIPCLFLVAPPLIGSVFVLLLWGKRLRQDSPRKFRVTSQELST